jgi:hypothetical protein
VSGTHILLQVFAIDDDDGEAAIPVNARTPALF